MFRGTEQTLPTHFSITAAAGTDIYRGVFDSTTDAASAFTGIMAATTEGLDYSLAWREDTGSALLQDGRVLFTFTNNTGQAITGFNFSYDVEAWVNGRRDNQVRFRYDVYADSAASQAAEGRNAFETDVAATINPNHTPIATNGDEFVLDGKAAANRVTVNGQVDLTTLLLDSAAPGLGTFGALLPGQTAYFRWQISNANLNNGNRSALGIDNFSLTAIAAGAGQAVALEMSAAGSKPISYAPFQPASETLNPELNRIAAFDRTTDVAIEALMDAEQPRVLHAAIERLNRAERFGASSREDLLLAMSARDTQWTTASIEVRNRLVPHANWTSTDDESMVDSPFASANGTGFADLIPAFDSALAQLGAF